MTQDVCYMDATEMAEKIRSKELSPVEVVKDHLDRIEKVNPRLNAIVTLTAEQAMERAREAEDTATQGKSWGPLHGVPFTIKDCVDTAGVRTTRGSRLFEDYVPRADATVVDRLRQAGGILLGKTNMPEFALWWQTDNALFGRTNNPWDLERTPGGSSGGEGAAISAGLSPLGIGSDLGGSIRQPANYCNIVGIKSTHGRVPLTGHWPDVLLGTMHVGPMTRTVRDAAMVLRIIAGPDAIDPYALPMPMPSMSSLDDPLPRLRVGLSKEVGSAPVAVEVQRVVSDAAKRLEEMGCTVEEAPLQFLEVNDPQAITLAVYTADSRAYINRLIEGKYDLLHENMQRRTKISMPTLERYEEAREGWETIRHATAKLFRRFDLLLTPVAPMPPFLHDQADFDIDGVSAPARHALRSTVPWDLTGSPAISVPFGWTSQGLPVGVQLVARHMDETTLFQAAAALTRASGATAKRPPLAE